MLFTPDFTSVDASIPVYEKGRYRIQITGRKPFMRIKKDEKGNETTIGGVRYSLEMFGRHDDDEIVTEDLKGRQVSSYTVWLHTEGGWLFAKPFLMAACGYGLKEEEQANEELFGEHDWSCNGEVDAKPNTFEMGEGWDLPVGQLVDVNLSIEVQSRRDGEEYENQDLRGWTPVEG